MGRRNRIPGDRQPRQGGLASGERHVDALSLLVNIEDLNGSSLYAYAGGIQMLSKLAPGEGQFSGNAFVPVPKAELLADQERIQQAVSHSLGPFFKSER
jgi:hypothetical protein